MQRKKLTRFRLAHSLVKREPTAHRRILWCRAQHTQQPTNPAATRRPRRRPLALLPPTKSVFLSTKSIIFGTESIGFSTNLRFVSSTCSVASFKFNASRCHRKQSLSEFTPGKLNHADAGSHLHLHRTPELPLSLLHHPWRRGQFVQRLPDACWDLR